MTTRQRSTSSSMDPPVRREVVLGVDTHGEVHVAAVVSPLGKVLGTESFPVTAVGYRRLLVWARKRGTVRRNSEKVLAAPQDPAANGTLVATRAGLFVDQGTGAQ